MNKQILLLTTDFPPNGIGGGIANFLHSICHVLTSRAIVIAPSQIEDSFFDAKQSYVTIRFPIKMSSFWHRFVLLPLLLITYASRQISSNRAIVVVGGFASFSILLTLAYLKFRYHIHTKLVVHGGDLLYLDRASFFRRGIESMLLRKIDSFVANSNFTKQILLERFNITSKKITVLRPGIFAQRFQVSRMIKVPDWPDTRKKILTVARLVPHKGVDKVIRALALVVEQNIDVGYIVVGTGPEQANLEALVHTLDLKDRVHFSGFVSDDELPCYYHSADVFALLSHEKKGNVEGFGIVFLEANACGIPVVGSNSGGISDAVQDGVTGILVDPDNIKMVSGILYKLLTDLARAKSLGETGRQRVFSSLDWAQRGKEIQAALLP